MRKPKVSTRKFLASAVQDAFTRLGEQNIYVEKRHITNVASALRPILRRRELQNVPATMLLDALYNQCFPKTRITAEQLRDRIKSQTA